MNESSVPGKLIGLDELTPRQYARKHRKVQSENYLRRVASIGVREKQFSTEHASFRIRLDEQKEFKNVLHCHLTAKKAKTASSLSEADLGIMRQNGRQILFHKMPRTSPECPDYTEHVRERQGSQLIPQRHHRSFFDSSSKFNDRKADSSGKSGRMVSGEFYQFSRPIFESNDNASLLSSRRIAFQKPKSNLDFSQNATRSYEKPNAEYKQSKYGGYKTESIRQTSRLSREIPYWMKKKTSHGSASSSDSTVIERPRNQNRLEVIKRRWFLKKHESDSWQQHNFSTNRSNLTDQPRSLRNNFVEIDLSDPPCQSLNSRFYSSTTLHSHIKGEKWAMKKSQENEPKAGQLVEENSTLLELPSVDPQTHNDEHEPVACIFSGKEDHSCSYLSNASIQQAEASTGFQEEGSVISHCSDTVPESLVSLDEAYQSSPVSVLQPLCKEEASPGAQSIKNVGIDVGDLRLQLELLVSKPGMNVSTDEDSEGRSVQKFNQNEDVMRFLKTDDSRDFAYLADVLTEVCLHGKSLDLGFGNWHSLESPISISVFDTLEKKFGEQMGWKRSERRLLFDRINSGLVEILQSLVCVPKWAKPVSRRFRNWPSQDTLEDELWVWIDEQKKDTSKDFQKKSLNLGLWEMDIGENIDAICRELLRSMMDELAAEFVGFCFTDS